MLLWVSHFDGIKEIIKHGINCNIYWPASSPAFFIDDVFELIAKDDIGIVYVGF